MPKLRQHIAAVHFTVCKSRARFSVVASCGDARRAARCRHSPGPLISRGWEYLKRICVPYTDIHTNLRSRVRASNELPVLYILSMETCFLASSLPLSPRIKFVIPDFFKSLKMSGLLGGTSEKTYEEQYTLSVAYLLHCLTELLQSQPHGAVLCESRKPL